MRPSAKPRTPAPFVQFPKNFCLPRYTWGPVYGSECLSLTEPPFADLTDVTLAEEDNNSIPTDDLNRTITGNVAMQVVPPGG